MRRSLVLLILGTVTVLVAVVGVSVTLGRGGNDDEPGATPTSPVETPTYTPPVPLGEVDTLTAAVERGDFCDAVAPEAVEAALGGVPIDATSYTDGQSAQVTGQVKDIAHEFACDWSTSTATVRAWVFAPPVTPRVANSLVRATRSGAGCQDDPQAPDFGSPSVALVCQTRLGVQASHRGLFGDAWLTCTVAGPLDRPEAVERADRWCSAVLQATAG